MRASSWQARSPTCSRVHRSKAEERGPPIQPVRVRVSQGWAVHQTGGIASWANRKLSLERFMS